MDVAFNDIWWPSHMANDVESRIDGAQSFIRKSVETQFNPDLCRYCRVFFDTWPEVIRVFDNCVQPVNRISTLHYSSIMELESSTANGCGLCSVFMNCIRSDERARLFSGNPYSLDWLNPVGRLSLYPNTTPALLSPSDYWYLEIQLVDTKKSGAPVSFRVIMAPRDLLLRRSLRTRQSPRPNPRYAIKPLATYQQDEENQKSTMALAKTWLKECHTKHEGCRQAKSSTISPTRLLRIGNGPLRLCLTTNQSDCPKYCTLSHCWGSLEFLRLLTTNLQSFFGEIPRQRLSKTFRDAIQIAQNLGFSWLWIDSLCIIQDDPDDWRRESALMASVYGLSDLNILATAAPDGSVGCVFPRGPTPITRQIHAESDGIYDYADAELYWRNVAHTPLARRAWVLQERILAPRNLYFGVSEIVWECATKFASSSFPDGIPKNFCDQYEFLSKEDIWRSWEQIIYLYTASSLTYQSDRLIAIAGIAREVQENTGDDYFAGLWKRNIGKELCWWSVSESTTRVRGRVPIPSWSWAATDGQIRLPATTNQLLESYIKIVDIHVDLDGEDIFGSVKGGRLTISSRLLVACTIEPATGIDSTIVMGSFSIEARVAWDYDEDHSATYVLFPIGLFRHSDSLIRDLHEGVLLRSTGRENGQYVRAGKFGIPADEVEDLGIFPVGIDDANYMSVKVDEDGFNWYTVTII